MGWSMREDDERARAAAERAADERYRAATAPTIRIVLTAGSFDVDERIGGGTLPAEHHPDEEAALRSTGLGYGVRHDARASRIAVLPDTPEIRAVLTAAGFTVEPLGWIAWAKLGSAS